MEIKGSVVVITGAGRGVGRATAIEFGRLGAKVALVARTEPELEGTAEEVRASGGEALVGPADVTDEAQVASMAERVLGEFGRVDVLVNNAGIARRGTVETMSLEDWNRVLAVNLTGPFLCSRAFIPSMVNRRQGHIINISSGAGKHGYHSLAAYSASKFGLVGLSESMAAELGDAGIKVATIFPGTVDTAFSGRRPGERPAGVKMLRPEDVAVAIAALVAQSDYAWTQEMNLWPFR